MSKEGIRTTKNSRLSRRWPIIVGLVLIALGLIIGIIAFHAKSTENTTFTPSISTVLPKGKSIQSLGGWNLVSPAGNDPVYAYVDSINGVAITVSQQTLPKSLQQDTDAKVAELAKAYSATNKIAAGEVSVYIGTNAKGPQSVIFTKEGLLIMIKSKGTIKESDWATYIQSLS